MHTHPLRSLAHLCLTAGMLTGCAEFFLPPGSATSSSGRLTDAERREAYVQKNATLSPAVREAILKGSVIEGMTEPEVTASLGRPILMSLVRGGGKGYTFNEYDKVAYGTSTSFEGSYQSEGQLFSAVRIITVFFSRDRKVTDMTEEVLNRDDLADRCTIAHTSGEREEVTRYCDRLRNYGRHR